MYSVAAVGKGTHRVGSEVIYAIEGSPPPRNLYESTDWGRCAFPSSRPRTRLERITLFAMN